MRSLSRSSSAGSNQSQSSAHSSHHVRGRSSKLQDHNRPPLINRTASTSSTISHASASSNSGIDAPILIYHESARSIVFRDHMRRAVKKEEEGDRMSNGAKRTVTTEYVTELMDADRDAMDYVPPDDMIQQPSDHDALEGDQVGDADGDVFVDALPDFRNNNSTCISNCFQPTVTPLPKLALGHADEMQELLDSPTGRDGDVDPHWTLAEREVVDMLANQRAVVKTIKNVEWTPFLHRFQVPKPQTQHHTPEHHDIAPREGYPFTSFVTSCSLLPPYGQKMRSYGSPTLYTAGVVFALPQQHENDGNETVSEDEAAERTKTWSWPPGYFARTEFNIDGKGHLINGRKEAMAPLSGLRELNVDYLTKTDHSKVVKGGLNTVPYNEIYVRVGGLGRIVDGKDVITGEACIDGSTHGRSFDKGLGLPVALFVRTATYGHLISLIRTRARLTHVLGENRMKNIPLLLITPELGVRVLTETLQATLYKVASQRLNPFQNPSIAHKTTVDSTGEEQLEQKLEELIDLDDNVRKLLTPEECVRLAGGFGATDESVAAILRDAMMADKEFRREHKDDQSAGESHILQDIVNEGLAAAVRSGDYYTSRQLLILYSLVASNGVEDEEDDEPNAEEPIKNAEAKLLNGTTCVSELKQSMNTLSKDLKPPPPPPLDTDRLRGATNSDGLLAVLGAAQVLKAMQDGGAKRRTDEVILALDEWIEHGEQSMTFRLASWRDQRAAQGDLKIAMERDSSFMAFVSNKAISNRKAFVAQLKQAAQSTNFSDVRLLSAVEAILSRMHSPCLRLELLQYVLGLDNRYSVAHVTRSVELAKTCLGLGGDR